MTARSKSLLKYLFSLALMLFFLYLAFRETDTERLYASIRSAKYSWLILMFLMLMASHILRSWRWRYLLEPIKARISLRNLFSGVMVGYLVNNILPRAGELVRPYAIGKLESISKSAALGTIIVERIMDVGSFLILLVIIPLVYDGPLRQVYPWLEESGIVLSIIMGIFTLVVLVLMLRRDWTTRVIGLLQNILPEKAFRRLNTIIHSFLDGFLFIKHPKNFLVILILSVGVWTLYIGMMYVAFCAFDLQHQLGWRAAVVVLAISSIGIAMPTPGSTGSYHMFTSGSLSRLFLVPEEVALGYATMTHAVAFIGVSLVGLFFFFRDHMKISEAVGKNEDAKP